MPVLAGLLGVFAFSLYDLLVRALGHQVSPSVVLLSTNSVLCLVAFSRLYARKQGFWPANFWGWPAIFGIAKAINIVCSVLTFRYLSVAEGYLLIFTYPIWTVVLDALVHRRFLKRHAIPLILAVVGVSFVYCSRDTHLALNIGVLWGLLTAFLCGSSIVMARHLHQESLFKLSFSSSLFCLAIGILGIIIGHAPKVEPQPSIYWQLPLLILFSVSGSLGALFAAQKLPPIRAALLCYLQIPVAVFLAWLTMHETITIQMGIGLALIVAGSLTAQMQRTNARAAGSKQSA